MQKIVSADISWICYSDMIRVVCRPGRLTDGPYTSYDLNTLLKATAGERRAVVIGKGYLSLSPAFYGDLSLSTRRSQFF